MSDHTCYVLVSDKDPMQVYTGKCSTSALQRRLKRHNGVLANSDSKHTKKYRPWRLLFTVDGFASNTDATQFEYAMKRKRHHRGKGPQNRALTLLKVLGMQRVTKKALPLATMSLKCRVNLSKSDFSQLLGQKLLSSKFAHTNFSFASTHKNENESHA